jgi:hypothetical protein
MHHRRRTTGAMDVFSAAVLERSLGGAMPQGAFSEVIRRGPCSHDYDWRAVFSAKTQKR